MTVHWPLDGIEWEDNCLPGDGATPGSRLLATVYLGATPCHLDAYEVEDVTRADGGVYQQTTDGAAQDDYDEWYLAAGADGSWVTTTIGGRTYVVFLSPFCA